MLKRWRGWLFDRLEITPQTLEALDKPLPRGVGWLNTLGSAALLLIGMQAITGIFLALYYAPVPGGAYMSARYIDEQLPFGRIVRGIHHYGSSAVVIVVFLHLLRTFFAGAFKPPRELIWVLGMVIYVLVMGFGFTGYLLPWDQKAYWATVVGTEIPGSVPVVGKAIRGILRGGEEVGAVTLTHFYAIHVLLLPALLFPAIGLHLFYIWRKGPTPPGTRVGEKAAAYASRFVQHQMFKDAVVMLGAFAVVYGLAWLRPVELEFIANPADQAYTPRPDWYFLFLFQFLKDVGALAPWLPEWIPAVVIPGIGMAVLFLMPWLDRSPERRWSRRPFWSGAAMVVLAAMVALTVRGLSDVPDNITPRNAACNTRFPKGVTPEDRALIARGKSLFETGARPVACAACHKLGGRGGTASMPLDGIGTRRTYEWLLDHTRDPQKHVPGSTMPAYPPDHLSDADLRALTDYMIQPTNTTPPLQFNSP